MNESFYGEFELINLTNNSMDQLLKPDVKIEMSDIIKFVKSFQIIMLKKLSTAADEEEIRKKQITDLNEKVRII